MRSITTTSYLYVLRLVFFCVMLLLSKFGSSQTSAFDDHITKYMEFKKANDSLALFHLEQARLSLSADYEKGYKPGIMFYNLGYVDYGKGDFKGALENFFAAERNFLVSGDSCELKNALFNIAGVTSTLGNNVAAIKYYTKYNEIKNCENNGTSKLLFYYDMGLLFSAIGQHSDALAQYELALKQESKIESDELNRLLVELAINFEQYSLGNIRAAIDGNRNILNDSTITKYPEDALYYGFSELGTFYLELDELDSADYFYSKAQAIPKTIYQQDYKLMDLINFANLKIKKGELDKALAIANEALSLATEIGHEERKRKAYSSIITIYEKKGDWELAYQKSQILRSLEDSLEIEKTKFTYLINEIELQSTNLVNLEKKIKIGKLKVSQRNLALIFCAFLILLGLYLLYALKRANGKHVLLNKKLEASNMNRGKIIATLTHDIRSPLGDVENILDLMKMDVLSIDDKSTIINTLREKIAGLRSNVDEILNWSINQLKGGTTNKAITPVWASIEKALSYVKTSSELKNIRISTGEVDRNLLLNVDPTHAEVIIRNVLSNAVKFSNPTSDINIFTTDLDTDVAIGIQDFGKGINENNIKKVLGTEVYKSEEITTGKGIGLRLVKEYLNLNNGRIELVSKVNEGSTFTIYLPKADK